MSQKKLAIVLPSGGTRGIITSKLFEEITKRATKLALEAGKEFKGISPADYLAGTSIGSIMVGAIANSNNPEDLIKIFRDNAGKILNKSSFLPISKSYYSSENLENILNEKIGDKTLGETKQKILITSHNLEKSQQTTFTNFGSESERKKLAGYAWGVDTIKLKDVVQASSAVPGVFHSKEIEYARDCSGLQKYHEVDGVMQNNSPVMDLVLAMNSLEKINFKDMFILSIGTGALKKDEMVKMKDKGVAGHIFAGKDIAVAHLCVVQDAAENQAKLLVESHGGKFFKIEPEVSVEEFCAALDASKKQMDKYEDVADKYISMNDVYLNEVAAQIVEYCL